MTIWVKQLERLLISVLLLVFGCVAKRSVERFIFVDETVAAQTPCADAVAGNFAPRSAERGALLLGETVEAFPPLQQDPAVESTVLQSA